MTNISTLVCIRVGLFDTNLLGTAEVANTTGASQEFHVCMEHKDIAYSSHDECEYVAALDARSAKHIAFSSRA